MYIFLLFMYILVLLLYRCFKYNLAKQFQRQSLMVILMQFADKEAEADKFLFQNYESIVHLLIICTLKVLPSNDIFTGLSIQMHGQSIC